MKDFIITVAVFVAFCALLFLAIPASKPDRPAPADSTAFHRADSLAAELDTARTDAALYARLLAKTQDSLNVTRDTLESNRKWVRAVKGNAGR